MIAHSRIYSRRSAHLIPRYAPGWTDHNVSDPGITVLELFAWLTEAMLYRINRVLGCEPCPPAGAARRNLPAGPTCHTRTCGCVGAAERR